MLSRAFRRMAGTTPKFTRGKYSIRVSKEKDVSFATAHVDDKFHHFILNGCWGLTAFATTTAFYQFVTNLHTVPITGRTQVVVFSREDDTAMGNQHAQEALAGKTLVNSGPRFKMVKDVASRLVAVADKIFEPGFQWQIYLVQDPQINACCFMGGKMFVYTGLLDFIDAMVEQGICSNKYNALATVLGHEIAHALARHTAETLSYLPLLLGLSVLTVDSELIASIFTFFCQLPFSRLHESEADHIGLMLMAAACYDPSEAPKFWEGMKLVNENGYDWFSTHPADEKRQKHLQELTADAISYQEKASWCVDMQTKVTQLIYKRITRRRATAGTTHSAEMAAMWDGMQAAAKPPQ
ncbi:hypothetical protein H310_12178 [Aphanomyces invadans]|uniref:Peptidase M48 domain-containing protein n=2 Tax=Aphanomyces invadans TaxID=157072 RepID=A0A024TJE4_9STRA|nr:hypothetical protein H310_12178 [Aphanomyces invadans]ETV94178.1 hypothetical protein H310_12178 [Aphanomyces invadans]|eukprot:XP_008877382.1 hypothetical protein H310_12178 [Aphanomyces invadans]